MTHQDLKLYILNLLTFTLSFSNIETYLRIFLLIISIVYTLWKLIALKNGKKDD
jgi:hypothetical protein